MSDVLTAHELASRMIALSAGIDQAVAEYKTRAEGYAKAKTQSEFAQATAYPQLDKRTVDEKRALVTIAAGKDMFAELQADALRNSADRALKAKLAQLSALQSLAAALREELRLARTDNYT